MNPEIRRLAEALIMYDPYGDCEDRPNVDSIFLTDKDVIDGAVRKLIDWRDMIHSKDD